MTEACGKISLQREFDSCLHGNVMNLMELRVVLANTMLLVSADGVTQGEVLITGAAFTSLDFMTVSINVTDVHRLSSQTKAPKTQRNIHAELPNRIKNHLTVHIGMVFMAMHSI